MANGQRVPLSNVDTAWLRMEKPTNLMMITSVMMFDSEVDMERLKLTLEHRFLSFSRFRQKVVEYHGHPHWVDDEKFDINMHVHRIALPAPHDENALQELVSDLVSTPLDFSKALWQLHLVENFNGGCAVILRIHHCIADGIALVYVLLSMTDKIAEAPPPEAKKLQESPRHLESPLAHFLKPAIKAVSNTWKSTESLLHQGAELLKHPEQAVNLATQALGLTQAANKLLFLDSDRNTLFKGELGYSKRAVWTSNVPLPLIKQIGKALGGTVNDVVLTIVAGALRQYLSKHQRPTEDLQIRAIVPVNLRPPSSTQQLGNQFGLIFLNLPLGVEDPRERLLKVKQEMTEIKTSMEAVVVFSLLQTVGLAPSEIEEQALKLFGSKATAVMTNVKGPSDPIYFAGAKISKMMFWVPQSGGLGMGVSIMSYAGSVIVGLCTDGKLVPDPEKIVEHYEEELEKLCQLAGVSRNA